MIEDQSLTANPIPIAVVAFVNQTGEKSNDNLRELIPDLLITKLEQSKYLRVTTLERMRDLLKQMGKGNVDVVDKELGFEACRKDGVGLIVLGSFGKIGDTPVFEQLRGFCRHSACPVPTAVIKGIEVACGLALAKDASIHIEKDL